MVKGHLPTLWKNAPSAQNDRGKHLHIVVENPEHAESGCKEMYVNGERMEGNYIPESKLTAQTEIKYVM